MQSRRRWLLASAVGASTLTAPSIVRAEDCTEDTLDRMKRTGVFNLGVRDATPPYGFKQANGEYSGFATDIAHVIHQAVSKELGKTLELTYTPVTGQTRLPLLQNSTIDMEAGATVITQARTKIVDFVMPHFLTSTEVMVPADSPIHTLADLAGKRIGVPQGGLEEPAYRDLNARKALNPPVRTIGFPDHPQGVTALQTGSIDGYSTDGPILYGFLTDKSKWRVVEININTFLQACPIRSESSKFKHIADVALANMFASGEWNTLYEKYFGANSKSPFPLTDTLKAMAVMNAWPPQ